MCSRVKCSRCSKATWSGCGSHAEQVLKGVRPEDRCTCAPQQSGPNALGRLFGRR